MKKIFIIIFTVLLIILGSLVVMIWSKSNQQLTAGLYLFSEKMTKTSLVPEEEVFVRKIDEQFQVENTVLKNKYSSFYYDTYRNQKIYFSRNNLNYLIDKQELTTRDIGEVEGYVLDVFSNETYLIGLEMLSTPLTDDAFLGTKTRVINLETKNSIVLDGFVIGCSIVDKHAFCRNSSDGEMYQSYLEVINLETMQVTNKHIMRSGVNEIGDYFFVKYRKCVDGVCENGLIVHDTYTKQVFFVTDTKKESYETAAFNQIPLGAQMINFMPKEKIMGEDNPENFSYLFSYRNEVDEIQHMIIQSTENKLDVFNFKNQSTNSDGVKLLDCVDAVYDKNSEHYYIACTGKKDKIVGTYISEYNKDGEQLKLHKISENDGRVLRNIELFESSE